MSYDTKEGIAAQLGSYETFFALMAIRREQGSKSSVGRSEGYPHLNPYIILGRYRSDQFGQCHRLSRTLFSDADRAAMPPVMTEEEFMTFFSQQVQPRVGGIFFQVYEGVSGMSPGFPLPPPHVVCARCNGTWQIDSCHDIDSEGDFELLNLSGFVGKTLRDVEVVFAIRTDALRAFGHPLHVQNGKWAEPATNDPFATPEELGWHEVTWDHVVAAGDQVNVFRYRFYHGECFRTLTKERLAAKEAADFEGIKEIFELTGFEDVKVSRVPVPGHLHKWIATGLDQSEKLAQLLELLAYYRVETRLGSLGVMFSGYPMLDLEGSGVTLEEMNPELAAGVPPDFPPITGFTGEPEQLLELRQHMLKHQTQS